MSSQVDFATTLMPWLGIRPPTPLARERREAWQRPHGQLPRVLGHRGARHIEPENTLLAFSRALEEGAHGIELDVRLTADGVPVIAHDEHLPEQASDPRGPFGENAPRIGELSASQLSTVRLAKGEHVPTLREALAFKAETGALMNVELKRDVASRAKLVQVACALLDEFGGDGVLVSSFDPAIVRAVAMRCPDIPVAWLVHNGQRLLRTAPLWQWTGAAGVNPEAKELSAERVQKLKAEGALVNVWTVNDSARAIELAEAGVDGIITDTPATILAALRARS